MAAAPWPAEAEPVRRRLDGVTVGPARSFGGVTVWPLLAQAEGPVHLPLAPALTAGVVTVEERDQADVVNLTLANRGLAPVLIIDGEEVVGGWQNRVATTTALIGAGRRVTLPVHCVERGRWDRSRQDFGAGEVAPHRLRARIKRGVQASLRSGPDRHADQGEVWDEVDARLGELGGEAPTGALHDAYRGRAERLTEYERALPPEPGACGLAVAVGGRVTAIELFNQPATAALYWPRLARAAALEALAEGVEGGEPAAGAVAKLLAAAGRAAATVGPGLDLGREAHLAGQGVTGTALVDGETVVHLALFPADR